LKSHKVESPAKNADAFVIKPGLKWVTVMLVSLGYTVPMEVVDLSEEVCR